MKKKQQVTITDREKEVLATMKTLLETNLHQHYTIEVLTQLTGFNRTKLNQGFKQISGTSIHQHVIHQRIAKAQLLLLKTELPIKAIAIETGFKTSQHFITSFKKTTGFTPGQFQQMHCK